MRVDRGAKDLAPNKTMNFGLRKRKTRPHKPRTGTRVG